MKVGGTSGLYLGRRVPFEAFSGDRDRGITFLVNVDHSRNLPGTIRFPPSRCGNLVVYLAAPPICAMLDSKTCGLTAGIRIPFIEKMKKNRGR